MSQPVAIVTGAGRGIGAATVAALVADGWWVAAVDRCTPNPAVAYPMASADELAAVVAAADGAAAAFEADVADGAAMADVVASVTAAHGRLDAVVCAAGIVAGGMPAWEIADEAWDAVIGTDLTGVFATTRAAVPAMLGGAGRIVTVASAAGSLGLRHMSHYAAAKHGVIGFTRSLAADLAGTGITANAVSPGSTTTAGLDESARIYDLDSVEDFVRHQEPLGRLIEPDEIAATIAWLCSPASSAITGAVIPVDGGMTATP